MLKKVLDCNYSFVARRFFNVCNNMNYLLKVIIKYISSVDYRYFR